jgi:hypothetical protein
MTIIGRRRAHGGLLGLYLAIGSIAIGSVLLACAAPAVARAVAVSSAARPLMVSAQLSRQADRTLVLEARTLERCVRAHQGHSGRCAPTRRALQQAGVRLQDAELHLARVVRATGRSAAPASARSASAREERRAAPQLSVSGETLSWAGVKSVRDYVLVRKVPGQADRYSVVHGTSATPPPVPGVTVRYSVRTAARFSVWATEQAIGYPAASEPVLAPDTQAAPAISVSGQTLTWNATAGVSTYVLVSRASGRADQYSEVSGTSITPPPTPGATIDYSVRTAVEGSAWASEVAISYPSDAPSTTGGESPSATEPPSPSATFQPGINSGSAAIWELPGATQLGAKLVRIAEPIEETTANLEPIIAAYADKGVRVLLLACFDGTLPTPAEDQNLATWASAFGPGGTFWSSHAGGQHALQAIEFGNETSFGYQYSDDSPAGYASRAQTYALRFAEAAQAVRAVNPQVGLLAQGDSGNAGPIWVENMFKAVPDLGSLVAGWTVHPYGDKWRAKLEELVSQTAAQGAPSSIPIDVTEWGLSSDNGRCLNENFGWNPCMSYQEAAEVLSRTVSEMRQALNGRLGMLLLYQIRDQKASGESTDLEYYFGALGHELQPKGAYTAEVESLLAS